MSGKTAIVLGGSGLVGQQLLAQLSADPYFSSIYAISRSMHKVPRGTTLVQVDFDHMENWAIDWSEAIVFIALGTTMAKAGSRAAFHYVDYQLVVGAAQMAAEAGASQVHVISAVGANSRSLFFYSKVKGQMEQAIEALTIPSAYVYQPSVLDGNRQEKRSTEQVTLSVMKWLRPLFSGPLLAYRPIHGAEVAAVMIQQAKQVTPGFHRMSSSAMHKAIAS